MKRIRSGRFIRLVLPSTILLFVLALHLLAQADPFLGTWTLDRAKSTFSGVIPNKRTMTFERLPDGSFRHVVDSAGPGGGIVTNEVIHQQYTFKIDGKEYPADPQMQASTVSFKRIDSNTLERTGKYRGEVVETVTYTVSRDGKTMTATQMGTANGAEVSSVQVFTRQ